MTEPHPVGARGAATDRLARWNPSQWRVASDWKAVVDGFFSSDAGHRLGAFVQLRLAAGATIFPPQPLTALALTPLASVKVVILGQDPYHGMGQAHGLAFSVAPGARPPPSLVNIQAEIARERMVGGLPERRDAGPFDACEDLTRWARQGVLLLNTCLTVEQGMAGSHARRGWEVLTDAVIKAVNEKQGPAAYMLWGRHAQARRPVAGTAPPGAERLYLCANHPSPLSARRKPTPFVGCGHFAQANEFLQRHGEAPIEW